MTFFVVFFFSAGDKFFNQGKIPSGKEMQVYLNLLNLEKNPQKTATRFFVQLLIHHHQEEKTAINFLAYRVKQMMGMRLCKCLRGHQNQSLYLQHLQKILHLSTSHLHHALKSHQAPQTRHCPLITVPPNKLFLQ